MKTRQQFILDTLKPYFLDPSTCAIEGPTCMYLTKDGRKCAVGKHLRKGPWQNCLSLASMLFDEYGMDILEKEAQKQELGIIQWRSIQRVHDQLASQSVREKIWSKIKLCEQACDVDLSELKELLPA